MRYFSYNIKMCKNDTITSIIDGSIFWLCSYYVSIISSSVKQLTVIMISNGTHLPEKIIKKWTKQIHLLIPPNIHITRDSLKLSILLLNHGRVIELFE